MDVTTFERVRSLVKERSAIVIDAGKEYLVESRLAPVAKARGFASIDAMCRSLTTQHEDLIEEVVEAMTTNETSFFRDHHPFEVLRETILPSLISSRQQQRSLRVWCAASSTGQEPFSVAMIIREHFPQLAGWDVRILATDLSRAVLDRAKTGRFRQVEVNRGLSAPLLLKYFRRDGLDFELAPELRKMVEFEEFNLIKPWRAMARFDLLFMRNVLIYFDPVSKRSILERARDQLADDGYLFLGGSESMPADVLGFERLPLARSGCYRVEKSAKQERRHA